MPKIKTTQKRTEITLLDAMRDPQLFAPWFKDPATWKAWRVALKSIFGLPLSKLTGEVALFQQITGRTKPQTKPCREFWAVVGRRGGKSFVIAVLLVYLACFRSYVKYLQPGERAVIMCLAVDRKQARVVMRYVQGLLERIPMLSRMVQHQGTESVDLSNMVTIQVNTASFRSTRGFSIAACVGDELAYWMNSEDSANPDVEIIRALQPAMATIPGSLLIGISSPYARRGVLWKKFSKHYGQDNDSVFVIKAPTEVMNPTIDRSVIEAAYADDPASAAAEYGAEFRSDVEAFLQEEWIAAAVREGVHEIPPVAGTNRYVAFCDPSGGSQDSFTLAIAHAEGKRVVLDVCRGRRPPFDPSAVTAEFASVLKRYGCAQVVGDRYSAEWVVSAFRQHGIHYQVSERTASEVFLEALPLFSTGAIELLDNRALLNELRQLERFTGSAKDRVGHPPRGHDDLAVSACGACVLAVNAFLPENSEFIVASRAERLELVNERLSDQAAATEGVRSDAYLDSPFLTDGVGPYESDL